jgi:hypothetical protein
VSQIYVEDDTNIWIATNKGLNQIVLSDKGYDIETVTFNDGLPSNNVTDIEILSL